VRHQVPDPDRPRGRDSERCIDEPPVKTLMSANSGMNLLKDHRARSGLAHNRSSLQPTSPLGHRVDAKARVGLDRCAALEIAETSTDHVGDLAAPGHNSENPGAFILHVPVEVPAMESSRARSRPTSDGSSSGEMAGIRSTI